jgi:hypothetical protein
MPSLSAPVQLSEHLYVIYAEFPHMTRPMSFC